MLVVFTTAIVVTSSIGDSFCGVVMNMSGAGGAPTMVDGFQMSRRGEAARVLSAAISTSWVNGLIWGLAVFLFLSWYTQIVLYFGTVEMFSFLIFAMVCVIFVSSKYWFRGLLALILGVMVGRIGMDPLQSQIHTFGWDYLADGVQIIPIMAGLLAVRELFSAYRMKAEKIQLTNGVIVSQLIDGIKDTWRWKWDGLRGGLIGGFVGLSRIGGAIADWFAYSQTVAVSKKSPNKDEIPVGKGNVRGVIGCEGAQCTEGNFLCSTVLFGIPVIPLKLLLWVY